MQFWIPVVSKWTTQKEYRTLADVPERIDCVVVNTRGNSGDRLVRCRKGMNAFMSSTHTAKLGPASWYLIDRVLDPIPDSPALTLDDIPDGRCIQFISGDWIYWKHKGALISSNGEAFIHRWEFNDGRTGFTILDLEMQLQDVPVTASK